MPTSSERTIRVWDPVVRLFHWTVAFGCVAAFLTEDLRQVHKAIGYVVLAALVVRLAWGFLGSRHARFGDFLRPPGETIGYARDLLQGRERRYLGHNPLGGLMVLVLMTVLAVIGISGWMTTLDAFWGVDWVEELHEVAANSLLLLVPVHLLGVTVESWRHRENLVRAMVTGDKPAGDAA
jgi:cytochrome b